MFEDFDYEFTEGSAEYRIAPALTDTHMGYRLRVGAGCFLDFRLREHDDGGGGQPSWYGLSANSVCDPTVLMLQNPRALLSTTLLGLFLVLGGQPLHAEEIFQPGDHCLAYRVEETLILFVPSVVVGKTCEVAARVERKGEQVRFEVSFPIRSLDSGNGLRDGNVADSLSVDTHPDIRFVSGFLTLEQVGAVLKQGNTQLPGVLEVAGEPRDVQFPIELSQQAGTWVVTGTLATSFTALKQEIPTVVGGLVADVEDELELMVHLRFDQVQGMADLQAAGVSQ